MQHKLFWACALFILGLTGLLAWRFPYAVQQQETVLGMFFSIAIFLWMAPGLIGSYGGRGGRLMKEMGLWALIVLVLVAGYAYRHELSNNRIVASLVPNQVRVQGDRTMEISLAEDGHFYIETEVNGIPVSFMVDTGASDIVLSPAAAASLGFTPETLNFTRVYSTANGYGRGAPVMLNVMRVGNMQLNEVAASVNDAAMDHSLLGMSFFRRLSGFEVQGDRMILRP